MLRIRFLLLTFLLIGSHAYSQVSEPDWAAVEEETLRHFRALLRFDTSDPPGRELPAAEYLRDVLEAEGIAVEMLSVDPERPNVVARLKGDGSQEPLLIMAHTDVVNVDPEKWTFPPFSATVDGGYVYGRGAVDDKDNLWFVETGSMPNRLVGFAPSVNTFFGMVEIQSGAGSVRHMVFHKPSRELWFGEDSNYIARAKIK